MRGSDQENQIRANALGRSDPKIALISAGLGYVEARIEVGTISR